MPLQFRRPRGFYCFSVIFQSCRSVQIDRSQVNAMGVDCQVKYELTSANTLGREFYADITLLRGTRTDCPVRGPSPLSSVWVHGGDEYPCSENDTQPK